MADAENPGISTNSQAANNRGFREKRIPGSLKLIKRDRVNAQETIVNHGMTQCIIPVRQFRSFTVKRFIVLVAAVLLFSNVQAQDDAADYEQVLPPDAQKCILPASPDAIPEDSSYDDLVSAKKQIAVFQGEIMVFRDCLKAAEEDPDNTPGNKAAIISSFNYSVEMEERVAERFNAAVRSYKERKAAAEG